ncbi:hypothetical protein KC362_g63 [Hortaea werneckii]|nr:hypothetical protein KC362_g63 [Hortaea werneckii]
MSRNNFMCWSAKSISTGAGRRAGSWCSECSGRVRSRSPAPFRPMPQGRWGLPDAPSLPLKITKPNDDDDARQAANQTSAAALKRSDSRLYYAPR